MESIGVNLVVIRHKEDHYFDQLENINIPIINGEMVRKSSESVNAGFVNNQARVWKL